MLEMVFDIFCFVMVNCIIILIIMGMAIVVHDFYIMARNAQTKSCPGDKEWHNYWALGSNSKNNYE